MSFECCGVPAALNSCIEVTIPGGTVCVVANMPKQVPLNLQVACRHEVPLLGDLGKHGGRLQKDVMQHGRMILWRLIGAFADIFCYST